MYPNNVRLITVVLLAFALFFSSCLGGGPSRTPATRFYVLNSLYSAENKAELTPVEVLKDVAIGVGPMTGTSVGQFYGPAAEELGGVFSLRGTNSLEHYSGAYGAARD